MNANTGRDSVIKQLRDVVPRRQLTTTESLLIAELQANRLLELFDITSDRVPNEIVTELPRIEVRYEHDLPVSGSTHWARGTWVVTLNADEAWVRQRFSLMHEFKHIIDHTTKRHLYGDGDERASDLAERAADFFAACVLMPKRRLKGLWFQNGQNLARCAKRLGVSTRALSVRLYYLGLAPQTPRCSRRRVYNRSSSADRAYLRVSRRVEELVA